MHARTRRAHTHECVRTYTRELIKKVKFFTFKLEQSYAHMRLRAPADIPARTHERMNAHTPAHAHARTHARMYAHERTQAHRPKRTSTQIHLHLRARPRAHKYIHARARARTHSLSLTHTNLHSRAVTRTRIQIQAQTNTQKHHTWIKACEAELPPPKAATIAYHQYRLPCCHCQMASLMATLTH